MIKSIAAKNFRKHTDLHVDLTHGLNVIRGANESGKSTLIEIAMYCLGGTKVLRDTIAETVTWGMKEKDMSAEAVFVFGGVDYRFTRSKGGAECNWNGGKVTGQAEVTAFAAQLIGVDIKTASLMMLSSQSGILGALDDDQGPAAVSGLMAKLADFDLVDKLLKNAESRLTLGSDATLRQKLAAAEIEEAEAIAAKPAEGLVESLQDQVRGKCSEHDGAFVRRKTVLHPAMAAAEIAYNAAVESERQAAATITTMAKVSADIVATTEKLATAQVTAATKLAPGALDSLRADVRREADHARVSKAWKDFNAVPAYPTVFWDQPQASFDAEVASLRLQAQIHRAEYSTLSGQVQVWTSKRITSANCPTCGQATTDDAHVAQHNGELDASIVDAQAKMAKLNDLVQGLENDLSAMVGVDNAAKKRATALAKVPSEFLTYDMGWYPVKVVWTAGVVAAEQPAVAALALAKAEAEDRAATMAEGQVAAHTATLEDLNSQLEALAVAKAAIVTVDIAPLAATYDAASAAHLDGSMLVDTLSKELEDLGRQLVVAQGGVALAQARIDTATKAVVDLNAELKTLAFNNVLVGKLKKLKPAITDFLWNTVLAAVSNFFSNLRGEQSVVTKDADGFKVNARSSKSLSGSTKDVLALAMRVALSKTFVPQTSMLSLDEPASGCDLERTASLLGFLSSVGFSQVILASHDPLSEAVADNLIELGA